MRHLLFLHALFAALGLIIASCNAPKGDNASTNLPDFEIASNEYIALAESALQHKARFDFDTWGTILADDVVYAFPDGEHNTRTRLVSKEAILNWWKAWRANSGIQSVTISEANWLPVMVNITPKAGALKGVYVIIYFPSDMVFEAETASVRVNNSIHFNDDRKID